MIASGRCRVQMGATTDPNTKSVFAPIFRVQKTVTEILTSPLLVGSERLDLNSSRFGFRAGKTFAPVFRKVAVVDTLSMCISPPRSRRWPSYSKIMNALNIQSGVMKMAIPTKRSFGAVVLCGSHKVWQLPSEWCFADKCCQILSIFQSFRCTMSR